MSLSKARPLKLELGKGKYQFPNDRLYAPVRKFAQAYQTAYNGYYQFRMYKLLHVAALKMLEAKLDSLDFQTALFAAGGLYLALNQTHASLAIEKTFGDFTSGFSHQFGVALTCMVLSEAYKVPWDKMNPIRVSADKSLDYEVELPNDDWLKLEAKGVSGNSLSSARSSIFKKKQTARANSPVSNTAMVGVIVQASRDPNQLGVIELIDPPFEPNFVARQPANQRAGRLRHYAALARFAGLEMNARELISDAQFLVSPEQEQWRVVYFRRAPTDMQTTINGRSIVGIQWRLGDGLSSTASGSSSQQEVWFYQGVERTILERALANELPEIAPFHFDEEIGENARSEFSDSIQDNVVHSFLPDGSYFGIGVGQLSGLLPISPHELSGPPDFLRAR